MEAPGWKAQGYIPKRYIVALMAFLGMVFNYMLRVNINLTIVAMVKAANTTNKSEAEDVCGFGDDGAEDESFAGEFEWNEWTQSLITGAFFWGYIWTQIPGGRLAEVFGARRVFGGALTCASIVSFFIPLAAKSGSVTLIVVRVILGLSEGATFPSTHALLATWAPPSNGPHVNHHLRRLPSGYHHRLPSSSRHHRLPGMGSCFLHPSRFDPGLVSGLVPGRVR
nr:putative inorganic phosphate cotransporter [Penaeus vannamei]